MYTLCTRNKKCGSPYGVCIRWRSLYCLWADGSGLSVCLLSVRCLSVCVWALNVWVCDLRVISRRPLVRGGWFQLPSVFELNWNICIPVWMNCFDLVTDTASHLRTRALVHVRRICGRSCARELRGNEPVGGWRLCCCLRLSGCGIASLRCGKHTVHIILYCICYALSLSIPRGADMETTTAALGTPRAGTTRVL